MVSMAIFVMVTGGIITAHLFGIRMYEISKAKLGVTGEARTTLYDMLTDVRSASNVDVGLGFGGTFAEIANGSPQQGSSIRVNLTPDTNVYICYYRDSDKQLKRMTSDNPNPTIVARNISNDVVFTTEDYAGNVVPNSQGQRVIGMFLQFYQIQYPIVAIPGQMYDYYQWRTKMTLRN